MDMQRIGSFLSQLRKEKGLTQERLGEQLGVSNKTVSRWETGTYLPPVEQLQLLSELYGITINEILSGERLGQEEYQKKAEENIRAVLRQSGFTLEEKKAFYQQKWLKDHFWSRMIVRVVIGILLAVGIVTQELLLVIDAVVAQVIGYVVMRNRMMSYIEERAFDGSGVQ